MKGITIIQPFAELIANLSKRCENRTWPTNHRGLIAIHAGKATRYAGRQVQEIAAGYGIDPSSLPYGAIVAVANLVTCAQVDQVMNRRVVRPSDLDRHPWLATHEHAHGPWAWVLEDVRRLPAPIPYKGEQGLWTVSADVEAQLMGHLAAA